MITEKTYEQLSVELIDIKERFKRINIRLDYELDVILDSDDVEKLEDTEDSLPFTVHAVVDAEKLEKALQTSVDLSNEMQMLMKQSRMNRSIA